MGCRCGSGGAGNAGFGVSGVRRQGTLGVPPFPASRGVLWSRADAGRWGWMLCPHPSAAPSICLKTTWVFPRKPISCLILGVMGSSEPPALLRPGFVLRCVSSMAILLVVPFTGPIRCRTRQCHKRFWGQQRDCPPKTAKKSFAKSHFGGFYDFFLQGRRPQGLTAPHEPPQVTPKNAGGARTLPGYIQTPTPMGGIFWGRWMIAFSYDRLIVQQQRLSPLTAPEICCPRPVACARPFSCFTTSLFWGGRFLKISQLL